VSPWTAFGESKTAFHLPFWRMAMSPPQSLTKVIITYQFWPGS
jgi:hypothetical protein